MFHVEVMRKEDEGLCGRICSGFTHLLIAKTFFIALSQGRNNFSLGGKT